MKTRTLCGANGVAAALLMLVGPGEARAQYSLTVRMFQGCPGGVTIWWTGAGPSGQQALVIGDAPGGTTIPNGLPCAGTVLGIQGHVSLVNPPGFFDVQGGSGMISGTVGPAGCQKYLQLIKGGSCDKSNIALIQ